MIRLLNAYFPSRTLILGATECLLVMLAFVLATVVRFGPDAELFLAYQYGMLKIALISGVFILCMYYLDLYDTVVLSNRHEVLSRIMQVLGVGSILLALVYYAYPQVGLGPNVFLVALPLLLLLLAFWRELFFWIVKKLRLARRAVLVGAGPLASGLATEVSQRPEVGIEFLGYVDTALHASMDGCKYMGGLEELPELVRRDHVDAVVIAMNERRGHLQLEPLLTLKANGIAVHDGNDLYERVSGKVRLDSLRLSWLLFSPHFQVSRGTLLYKRLFSIVGSSVALVLFSPLMLLIALAIWLESGAPVIFRQQRVGKAGRVFTLYKFRTMWHDRQDDGSPARAGDVRFTRVGRWLRRSRLDELPQLYNILRGDMYLVGPRPFVPSQERPLAEQIPFYRHRWIVRPGLTGWAQVNRGYCATLEDNADKLAYDLYYIKHMSFGLDSLILFQTIKILVLGRGGR